MKRRFKIGLLASACALLLSGLLAASVQAAAVHITPAAGAPFPQRSYLLTLPSRVPLLQSHVSVTENGGSVRDLSVVPASVVGESHFGTVLLIETASSMRGAAIQAAMGAARSFATHRNPQQPLGVVLFSSKSQIALPLTTDAAAIGNALQNVPPLSPGAHVFNAVSVGLQMLAQAHMTAGALIVLSDGSATGRLSPQAIVQRKTQVISTAVAQQARVYAIGVRDAAFNARTLQDLAASTGGTFTAVDSQSLTLLLTALGGELSNEYLIRYRSVVPPSSPVQVQVSVAGEPGIALANYSTPAASAPATAAHRNRHTGFWHSTTAAVLASLVCAAMLGFAVLVLVAPRPRLRQRLATFISTAPLERKQSWVTVLIERSFAEERDRVRRSRLWARFVEDVELARIGLSVPQIVAGTLAGTVVLGWILFSATGSVIGALLGLVVPFAVRVAIRERVKRQRRAFDEQLPDNLQVVASALRAGHTFVGSLAVMAEDAPDPSRRELRRVLADEQLGVPLVDALNAVTARMDSKDFEHVALVASLQRETGGNTAEVIDTVTETIRERLELRRLVRTLTAQGRLSGWIVSLLPVGLLLAVSLLSPHYVHPLFHRTLGIVALIVAVVMIGVGFWAIRRIVDIEI